MRIPFARIRAAFLVAATLALACSLFQGKLYANSSTPVMDAMGATAPSSNLTVTVTCEQSFGILWSCLAVASGGSGTGYTFTWYPAANVQWENENSSAGTAPCGGYPNFQQVRVTDSLGAIADGYAPCFNEW